MSGLQKQSLETEYIEGDYKSIFHAIRMVFLNEGYSVEESDLTSGFLLFTKAVPAKDMRIAAGVSLLPGGGSFYTENYGLGVFDLLFWPISIVWDMPIALAKANKMKNTIKVSVTLMEVENATEIRTSFSGVKKNEEYGIMLKRMYAEVRNQVFIRE